MKKAENVDEYIKAFPRDVQTILEKIRLTIQKMAPDAVETISYQMPTFKLNGKYLVYFAGWKNHVSIYPIPTGTPAFQKEISPYIAGKGTIKFPLDKSDSIRFGEKNCYISNAGTPNKMKNTKGTLKICNRGHEFYKNSDCPVCPKCWSGYYREKNKGDFPDKLSAPALRGLLNANITNLTMLSKFTEGDISTLHGVGPTALITLRAALKAKGLSFKISKVK